MILQASGESGTRVNVGIQQIYPNPANDYLQLELYAEEQISDFEIQLCDLNGRILQTRQFDLDRGVNTLQIAIMDLPEGMYYLIPQTKTKRKGLRFVKTSQQ